jgi:23S rRNA pseudouridine2605 synthase
MRLEGRLARLLGVARKDARRLVRRGRVTVDGEPCRDPARSVGDDTALAVDGEPVAAAPRLVAFHKPPGVQCTVGDPHGRPSLREVVGEWLDRGLHPVGRLDADSEGLLLLCSDGQLTQRLLHPKHGTAKVYRATVQGEVPSDLGDQLAAGVDTSTGRHAAALLEVDGDQITLSVTEGKHRMVRRMLANLGLPVTRLVRLRHGEHELGDLAPGQTRVIEA